MSALKFCFSPNPRVLLSMAADGLLAPQAAPREEPFGTPGYLLAVRQGGVRDDLLDLARARGVQGWFDPPLCLFQELPVWLGATALEPCGDYERLVLVSRAVHAAGSRVFARGAGPEAWVDALDRLFGELAGEGVEAEAFERVLRSRRGRDAFECARDDDIGDSYRFYREALRDAGRRDGRDMLADCANAVRAHPNETAARLGGRREVRIVGLQDLRGGWRPLLHSLRVSAALDLVVIYGAVRLDFGDELEPDETIELDRDVRRLSTFAFSAPDAERELEEVARRVRELVDGGMPPHRIAVVARHARPYTDTAVRTLRAAGLPVTARQRHVFAEVPIIRSLLMLFAVAREGWARHGLAELADQPYLGAGLDRVVIDHIGYRRMVRGLGAWEAEMAALLAAAQERERRHAAGEDEELDWRVTLPSATRVARALSAFREFASHARPLDSRNTLAVWLDWLETFLRDDPWGLGRRLYDVPDGCEEVVRLDAAGLRGARQVLSEWRMALERWGASDERMDVAAFEAKLREMLSGDVALWTATRRGVQVLEGLAAAHRSFDHVFLVGLAAGRFPVAPPRSPLLDDDERSELAAAGIPLEAGEEWERRERELFRVIVASAGASLTASWPLLDARGAEVVRSAFIEELLAATPAIEERIPSWRVVTPGTSLVSDRAAVTLAAHAASVERLRATGRPSAYNGLIEDPALIAWLGEAFGDERVWSPTQLEEYARCPWAYFSSRLLRLEKLEDPDIDLDPRDRGTLLHDALHRFYDAAVARAGGPVMLRAGDEEWVEPMIERALADAVRELGEGVWLGPASLRATKLDELRRMLIRYLRWEMSYNESLFNTRAHQKNRYLRTGVVEHERVFDDALLAIGGVHFRFRGRIDRIERGIDERAESAQYVAAVDYKSSKYSAPGGGDRAAWEDDVVLQLPLYAHALKQLEPGARVARVEYRAIRQGDVAHSLHLAKLERSAGVVTHEPEAAMKMERALAAVAQHVSLVRAGEFPASPAPSCGCPPFCHALEICRIQGGPRQKGDRR